MFNKTGVTVKFNSSGDCALYGSLLIQLPSEAMNDIALLGNGYHEEHVWYDEVNDKLYLTIECTEESHVKLEMDYEKHEPPKSNYNFKTIYNVESWHASHIEYI